MSDKKFHIQDSLYEFPYHHIPHFTSNGTPSLVRKLSWGFDYLCYQKHLHEKVVTMNPKSVLEVGCGDGYFIGSLPSSIPVRVGVDLSSRAIAFARAFHPECTFYDQDAKTIIGQFDVVAAIEVIEHIPEEDLPAFFQTLKDRINDGGKIILSAPTTVTPLNIKHYRHYTLKLLEDHIHRSGVSLKVTQVEYIFSKPWWMVFFKCLFNNPLFSLEIKPIMRFAWKSVWEKYRYANEKTGCHLVVVLERF